MGDKSAIEWTDATWNPTTGCTKISPGCKHCYAERMAARLQAMGNPRYANGFKLTTQPDALELPLRWKRPRRIFVDSMSDLFHSHVPDEYIVEVFRVMHRAHWHEFQVLTKRSDRLVDMAPRLRPLLEMNVWVGVSVENEDYVHRIDHLRHFEAYVQFLSIEPLLGPMPNLDLHAIDWVIVGGESGPGARVLDPDWVRSIRDQCLALHTPFFFKQWGGVRKATTGRELDGRTWDEMPTHAAPFVHGE